MEVYIMQNHLLLDKYYSSVIDSKLFSNKNNLKYHMNYLFKGTSFQDKRVLDIGGGNGIYSYYASCKGAKEVVCLEPYSDGSTNKAINEFILLGKLLKYDNVSIKPITFQDYSLDCGCFDIILLNNSINHLNENACINLLQDQNAKSIYEEIAENICSISCHGATIIICDCSRYNIFATLKTKNPFAPSIEWHKHQSPKVWSSIFSKAGFEQTKIRWSSFNRLRLLGSVLLGNKIMSYFLNSHFCLYMRKQLLT